jgi:hypothetical protein
MTPTHAICGHCGYDLRTIRASVCPECGTPRADAIAGGPLNDASKTYLLRLQRGLRLIFWGLLAELIFSAGWLLAAAVYMQMMHDPNATSTAATRLASQALFEGLGIFLMQIPLVLQLAGAWWYMQPELEQIREGRQVLWRWLTLAGFGCAVAGKLAAAVLIWAGFPGDPFSEGLTAGQQAQGAAVIACQLASTFGALLGLAGLLGFSQHIADRAGDVSTQRHMRSLKYGLIFLLPLGAVVPIFTWVALVLCLLSMKAILWHVKRALAGKPEFEIEEYHHARPLS